MKHAGWVLCAAICTCVTMHASSQTFMWSAGGGGVGTDGATGVAVDNAGNAYVTGHYNVSAMFGLTVLTSAGADDIFVAKYDPAGTPLWVVSAGGANADMVAGIGVDAAGNAYITGNFSGSATFGTHVLTSTGGFDVFVAKLATADGTFDWATSAGGTFDDNANAISVDAGGNTYATGAFIFSATFGTTILTANASPADTTSYTSPDAFIAKLGPSGAVLWANSAGSKRTDRGTTVTVDASHNRVFFAGNGGDASGQIIFGSYAWTGNGPFVAQYSETGTLAWVAAAPVNPTTMTLTSTGDLYLAGASPVGGSSIACFDVTSRSAVGTLRHPGNGGVPTGIVFSPLDNSVTVIGTFSGTVTIGATTLTSPTESDTGGPHPVQAGYMAQFDGPSAALWASMIASTSASAPAAVALDVSGNLYVAGTFRGVATWGTPMTSIGAGDAYVVKIGQANWVKGNVFNDANNNGTQDGGETGIAGITVQAVDAGTPAFCTSDASGLYVVPVGNGTYTISIPNPPLYRTVTPATHSATFTSAFGTSIINKNFALYATPGQNDGRITLIPLNNPRPGRSSGYIINYANVGTESYGCAVTLTHDPLVTLDAASCTPPYTHYDAATQTATWNIGTVDPGAHGDIALSLDVPTTATAGTVLHASATMDISPATDIAPSDNIAVLDQTVVNSYDPNDKAVVPGGAFSPAQILLGPWLTYTIRFQNTGTASAIDIALRDTIDTHVTASTIQTIASSHPYTLRVTGNGAAEWTFHDINLPDSTSNEHGSHGYVTYRVAPKTSLVLHDSIQNTASIYFDFNAPVRTNTTVTKIEEQSAVEDASRNGAPRDGGFALVGIDPNPTARDAAVRYTIGAASHALIDVVNARGDVVAVLLDGVCAAGPHSVQIPPRTLQTGSYWVRLHFAGGMKSAPMTVVR